jgi:hypothetical protein
LLGLLETRCFSLFSEGGRFHYEGFRFGSSVFGNIAAQVIAYCLTGAALTFLGYGHLSLRRWAAKLACCLMWARLLIGLPVKAVVFFLLLANKELNTGAAVIALAAPALSYSFCLGWSSGISADRRPGYFTRRRTRGIGGLTVSRRASPFKVSCMPSISRVCRCCCFSVGGIPVVRVACSRDRRDRAHRRHDAFVRPPYSGDAFAAPVGVAGGVRPSGPACGFGRVGFPAHRLFRPLAVLSGIPLLAGLLAAATSRRCFKDPRRPAWNQ